MRRGNDILINADASRMGGIVGNRGWEESNEVMQIMLSKTPRQAWTKATKYAHVLNVLTLSSPHAVYLAPTSTTRRPNKHSSQRTTPRTPVAPTATRAAYSAPIQTHRAGLFGPLGASPFSLPTVKRALAEMEGGLGRCASALDVAYSRAHRAPRSMKCRRVYLRVRRILKTTESWGEPGCDNRCGFACGCEWEDGAEDVESGGLQTDDANVGRKMGRNAKAKMFASPVPGRS